MKDAPSYIWSFFVDNSGKRSWRLHRASYIVVSVAHPEFDWHAASKSRSAGIDSMTKAKSGPAGLADSWWKYPYIAHDRGGEVLRTRCSRERKAKGAGDIFDRGMGPVPMLVDGKMNSRRSSVL